MSRNITFFYDNLAQKDTTRFISASSENPFLPMTNIADFSTRKVFRTLTGVNSATFVIDLGAPLDVDSFLVCGDSINGLGFTSMQIDASPNNNFTTVGFTSSIDLFHDYNFGIKTFAQKNFRFWRVSVTTTGNAIEVSKIFIGLRTELNSNYFQPYKNLDLGWNFSIDDNFDREVNRYGSRFDDLKNTVGKLGGSLRGLTETDTITLADIAKYCGNSRPIWCMLDPNGLYINNSKKMYSGYFYIDKIFDFKNDVAKHFSCSIELSEVV